jgi:hypothetical protein
VRRPNDKRWKQIDNITSIEQLRANIRQRFEVKDDKKILLIANDVEVETTENLQTNRELIFEEE